MYILNMENLQLLPRSVQSVKIIENILNIMTKPRDEKKLRQEKEVKKS